MAPGRIRRFFRWFYRNHSISPTSEGKRYVVLAVAVGLAAVNTGNNLLYLLLAMMLSLIVLSGVLSEQCLRQLVLVRRLPDHIFAGSPTSAHFVITNRKAQLPSYSLHLVDLIDEKSVDRSVYVLYLAPGSSVLRSYPLLIPRRGRYRIDGVQVQTRFPFSLFIKGLAIPLPSEVVVYPAITPIPAHIHEELEALGHEQQLHRRGQGTDLYNLRMYHPGDDSRSIHWRTTARTNLLIVRESQAEDQRRVTLALPTIVPAGVPADQLSPELEEAFEQAVELTASLAVHFHEAGFHTRVVIGEQEAGTGSGQDRLYEILRTLGLCQPSASGDSDSWLGSFSHLLGRGADGELTILVLPWEDPRLEDVCAGVRRVFRASDLKEFPLAH